MIDPDESFPDEVAGRLIDGESPLKVFREYRNLTVTELSERSDVLSSVIEAVEDGHQGSAGDLLRLAKVLDLELDDLI